MQRFIGCRKSVLDEVDKPDEDDWELLPHATLQYLLVPNAVLVHQIDHLELWRFTPLAPDRTLHAHVGVLAARHRPGTPRYYVKNLDVLLGVTNTEDFPMQELVQRNLASGAMPELVYGKMEPALVGYHTAINERLAAAGGPPTSGRDSFRGAIHPGMRDDSRPGRDRSLPMTGRSDPTLPSARWRYDIVVRSPPP